MCSVNTLLALKLIGMQQGSPASCLVQSCSSLNLTAKWCLCCRALLALCLIGAVSAQDDASALESVKSVFLPTTPNDFGGMIFSLLQEQANFLAAKDGAEVSTCIAIISAKIRGWQKFTQSSTSRAAHVPTDNVWCVHVQTEGSPLNLLTSMASWAAQAQTALFNMAPAESASSLQSLPSTPLPDPLTQLLNVTASCASNLQPPTCSHATYFANGPSGQCDLSRFFHMAS